MNIFELIRSHLRSMYPHVRVDPVRDWLMLLTASAIMLAGIIVWNVWAFDTVASGHVISSGAPQTAPIFDPATLDTIHTIFTNRAAEEMKYVTGTYRYADPSL